MSFANWVCIICSSLLALGKVNLNKYSLSWNIISLMCLYRKHSIIRAQSKLVYHYKLRDIHFSTISKAPVRISHARENNSAPSTNVALWILPSEPTVSVRLLNISLQTTRQIGKTLTQLQVYYRWVSTTAVVCTSCYL